MSKMTTTIRSRSSGTFEGKANRAPANITIIITDAGLKNASVSNHTHTKKVVCSIKSLGENPDCLTGICEEGETIWKNTF